MWTVCTTSHVCKIFIFKLESLGNSLPKCTRLKVKMTEIFFSSYPKTMKSLCFLTKVFADIEIAKQLSLTQFCHRSSPGWESGSEILDLWRRLIDFGCWKETFLKWRRSLTSRWRWWCSWWRCRWNWSLGIFVLLVVISRANVNLVI